MSISRSKTYVNKEFGPSLIANTLTKALNKLSISSDALSISATYDHGNVGEERKNISIADLEKISKIGGHVTSISISFYTGGKKNYGARNVIILQIAMGLLVLNCSFEEASYSNPIFETFEEDLELEKAEPKRINAIDIFELENRIVSLEGKISKKSEIPSCFLSYRFNQESKPIAFELSKFLDLLGVKVVSGMGYEPRRVTEKVMSKLKHKHDFFIYLITSEGESTWTRDELVFAFSTDLPVILLVEKSASIGAGLLGDWEYIEFERNHIGDTYIAILEAIKFINSQKEGQQSN